MDNSIELIHGDCIEALKKLPAESIDLIFDMSRGAALQDANDDFGRVHPTQKPVKLYKWILNNYAKSGDKILDTHVGSASSIVACHDLGFEWMGFEIDPHYFKLAVRRIEDAKAQFRMILEV